MVFNEPEHPFRESFQEEEVIRDRYATLGEAIAARAERGLRQSRFEVLPRRLGRRPRSPRDRKTLAFRPKLRRTSRRRRKRRLIATERTSVAAVGIGVRRGRRRKQRGRRGSLVLLGEHGNHGCSAGGICDSVRRAAAFATF